MVGVDVQMVAHDGGGDTHHIRMFLGKDVEISF